MKRRVLTESQSALAAKHVGQAIKIAANYARRLGVMEACSVAQEALCKAAFSHDPSRGTFSNFVNRVVNSALIDSVRGLKYLPQTGVPFDVPAPDEPDDAEPVPRILARARPFLSVRERAVMRECFVKGRTQAEAARRLKLTVTIVNRDFHSALNKIRENVFEQDC